MQLWELYQGKELYNGFTPTLERIKKAVKELNNPQNSYISILIGGTNGKGSVCAFLESLFRNHGFKTGRFVSPHLVSENERWRINNKEISENTLKELIKEIEPLIKKYRLTYFESATLIAALYFQKEKVDIAIIEVGLGGRWDATKIHNPIIVGITNVSRDHTRWLGETLEEIAEEKTELIYPSRPVVLGENKKPLIEKTLQKAKERKAEVIIPVENLSSVYPPTVKGIYAFKGELKKLSEEILPRPILQQYTYISLSNTYKKHIIENASLGLYGSYQIRNSAMALTIFLKASEILKFPVNTEKILEALKNTSWEGRLEVIRKKPLLILDGAHNISALKETLENLQTLEKFPLVIFGAMKDKEWKEFLKLIRKYTSRIYIVEIKYHRSEKAENMEEYAKKLNFKEIKTFKDIDQLLKAIEKEEAIILGSLYLIGEVKKRIKKET